MGEARWAVDFLSMENRDQLVEAERGSVTWAKTRPFRSVGPPRAGPGLLNAPPSWLRTAAGAAFGRAKKNFSLWTRGGQFATSWPTIWG